LSFPFKSADLLTLIPMASASTLQPSSGIEVLEAHARALGTLTDATPRVGYAPARKSGAQVHEMPHTHRGSKSPGRGLQSSGGETLQAAAMAAAAAAVLGGSGSNLITAAGGHADIRSTTHLNVGELQRVDPPRELHAPARFPMPSAPLSFEHNASSSPSKAPPPKRPSKVGHINSKIKDYEVRAAACLRAGRIRCSPPPPTVTVEHSCRCAGSKATRCSAWRFCTTTWTAGSRPMPFTSSAAALLPSSSSCPSFAFLREWLLRCR
jgi:hypothetical protein